MKRVSKVISVLLMASLLLGVAACKDNKAKTKSYTYNTYLSASPSTWNNHVWQTNADSFIFTYTEIGFYDIVLNEAKTGYKFQDEMAVGDPKDVTAQYAGNTKYGVPSDATEGYAWELTLNPNAKWANGDPITAHDYVYSLQQAINPKMQNYRANSYTQGDGAIANAINYFKSESPIYTDVAKKVDGNTVYTDITGKSLYFSLLRTTYFFGRAAKDYYDAGYVPYFVDDNGTPDDDSDDVDLYLKWKDKHNPYGWVEITEENKEEVLSDLLTLAANFGDDNPEAWKEFCTYFDGYSDSYDFDNVGIIGDDSKDPYKLTLIMATPISLWNFKVQMTSIWLVYEPLYEAGKETQGDLTVTNYGTSVDTYMSYGPYKLTAYQLDKQITLEKNENWYGYTDGKHEGQFQTTKISCQIIKEHTTALQLFVQGKLDTVSLTSTDMSKYRYSDYLLKTDLTYTQRFVFNTDRGALTKIQNDATTHGVGNRLILSYDDFRKAFSLAIDRAKFAQDVTAGYKPSYSLLNSMYYYDMENNINSRYRDTDQAKKVVTDLYGIEYGPNKTYKTLDEAYEAVTGYDLEEAKKLFQQAFNAAKEAGDIKDGDTVRINIYAGKTITAELTAQMNFIQDALNAATKGTSLEGKIVIEYKAHEDRYGAIGEGKVEAMYGAWGGAYLYPYQYIGCYTDPDYADPIHEYGFDPTKETFTITYDFDGDGEVETIEKTYYDWQKSVVSDGTKTGEYYFASADVKLTILAALEYNLLNGYHMVPVASATEISMYSQKVNYATTTYVVLAEYGGIRFLTYNYTDAEWAAYVKAEGGQLSYE